MNETYKAAGVHPSGQSQRRGAVPAKTRRKGLDATDEVDEPCGEPNYVIRDLQSRTQNSDVPDHFADLTGIADLERWPIRLVLSEQHGEYATGEKCLKLNEIVVEPEWRSRGVGSAALTAVCKFADHRQMIVWLVVHGSGQDPQQQAHNTRRLTKWYQSHRFAAASEADAERYHMGRSMPVMIRRPKANAQDGAVALPTDVQAELAERRQPVGFRTVWVRSATFRSGSA